MDGLPPGTWLGMEGSVPWSLNKNSIKYFLKHNLYVFVSKFTKYFKVYLFVINVGSSICAFPLEISFCNSGL